MNDTREGCVAVRVERNAKSSDFTVAAERHCIAPTGCWWPKCTCERACVDDAVPHGVPAVGHQTFRPSDADGSGNAQQ